VADQHILNAGNIAPPPKSTTPTTPKDLATPTIKQEIYTTGRGGSGNMVQNDPERPEIARESQDVELPPLRAEQYPHHTGRGMRWIISSVEKRKE
jgi:hypothetical protein